MPDPKNKIDFKKYFLVLVATSLIFLAGLYLGHHFEQQKLEQINSMRSNLELDILSTETQFSILETAICENLGNNNLTQEQYDIEETLSSMEQRLGTTNPQVERLRKNYFLLEIKNFLLSKKKKQQCDAHLILVLYFYDKQEKCPQCEQQGFVLTYLRKKYPFLRVYSFDYRTNLAAVETLQSLYTVQGELPVIVVDNETYSGFKNKEDVLEIMPPEFEQYKKEWKKKQKEKEGQATSSEEKTSE